MKFYILICTYLLLYLAIHKQNSTMAKNITCYLNRGTQTIYTKINANMYLSNLSFCASVFGIYIMAYSVYGKK